jgi:hypothetical protein
MRWIIGAVLAAGCATEPPSWTVDHVSTDGALLGVWGSGPDEVWAVGGQTDRALVMRGDGTQWARVDVDADARLWSIYGVSATDVYAVGEHGLILYYDGTDWRRVASGTDLFLYGVWASSRDDVWIVGGDRTGAGAVMLRGARDSFRIVDTLPAQLAPDILYKVHGFAPDNVLALGNSGMLRWDGAAWHREQMPTTEPMVAMWGHAANEVYAVGGTGLGAVVHWDGAQWNEVAALPIGSGLNGVFSSPHDPAIAVGSHAQVFELGRDGSVVRPTLPELAAQPFLHGVWGDQHGTTYVVGGEDAGLILRRQ